MMLTVRCRYGTGTECDSDCTGTVASQLYINTTITLREADTSFGDTIATGAGATYTGLTSSEGGKVWKIATISIPAMGSETAVASSTSKASHATPSPTTAVAVEETGSVATSTAQESSAAPTGSKTGFKSGAGSGSGSFSGFGAGSGAAGEEDCSEW